MHKKLVAIAASAVLVVGSLLAAGAASVSMGLAALSSGGQSCVPSGATTAAGGAIPAELAVTTTRGDILVLGAKQLQNASEVLVTARGLNASEEALTVMIITALQESKFWLYANRSVPASLDYPYDRVGSDHDSVNMFQQRANWGSVEERMDPAYATRAFFGGPEGPNDGSPAGLLDIAGWEDMEPGEAAQAVQVSAFPDAYDQWVPAAETLLDALGGGGTSSCGGGGGAAGTAVLPLDPPFNMTSGFGPRGFVVPGASTWHPAIDLQNWPNPCGRPVYAMMDGTVTENSRLFLSLQHPDGFVISYLHMYKSERTVDVGDVVTAGQQIGLVGNESPSSGCHIDVRINVTDNSNPQVAALPIDTVNAPGMVKPEDFFALFGLTVCSPEWCRQP